ncbi:MAG TPA: helix-turn-helix domain-containing protein [Ignavibacteriaceae bacterium]|jgi:excisionase family DNA binding protein|nr:helix-turn-helix domain-containing protein [Ignavibacteriaceae bacterium]
MKNLLSVKEVAKKMKLTKQAINIHIQAGRLKAEKVGNFWVIERKNLDKFLKSRK